MPRGVSQRRVLVADVVCTAAAGAARAPFLALRRLEGTWGARQLAEEPYCGTTTELENAADPIFRTPLGADREKSADGVDETVVTAQVTAAAKGDEPTEGTSKSFPRRPVPAPSRPTGRRQEHVLLLSTIDGGRLTPGQHGPGHVPGDDGHVVASDGNAIVLNPGGSRHCG